MEIDVKKIHPENRKALIRQLSYFLLVFPYMEWILRQGMTDMGLLPTLRSLTSAACLGMAFLLILTWIPNRKIARAAGCVVMVCASVIFIAEGCCAAFFGTYYSPGYMLSMSGSVAGEFMGTALQVLVTHWYVLIMELLPTIYMFVAVKVLIPDQTDKEILSVARFYGLVSFVIFGMLTSIFCHTGRDVGAGTYDYAFNTTVPSFGLINTLRLDLWYGMTGVPMKPVASYEDEESDVWDTGESDTEENQDGSSDKNGVSSSEGQQENEIETEMTYEANVMDIDFQSLMESTSDSTLINMDQYFSAQKPTMQNEYTGIFEGKNLIFITAEAFSTPVISQELTPTLYRLANEGFVFENFYQPNWTQSTQGGEFANMTGIIPTWIGNTTASLASIGNSMPFGMGWKFQEEGYQVAAYHNGSYTYYDRDQTHPTLGYDFYGIGNGLIIDSANLWPESDLEMIQVTIDEPIENYLATGQPFHNYYMSISGHCNYGFGVNQMSAKNRDAVENVEGSEQVRAYIACQLELEYALEYLIAKLEEAQILEDTVIVMSPDHYPYAMASGGTDYYNELAGTDDNERMTSRYRNTLIIWSGDMAQPVEVSTPCYAPDILPTVYNLFGIEYDSRLLSGRDILAPDAEPGKISSDMKIVSFPGSGSGRSWITAAGIYEGSTGVFTPFEGVTVSDTYVSRVSEMVSDRWTYAKYLIQYDYYGHVFTDD